MRLIDEIIELRILLSYVSDGFSVEDASKSTPLTTRIKVLFLLEQKDFSPSELIDIVGIAKSNLANLLKSMIRDGVVVSYKAENNSKNIFYTITESGLNELKAYKDTATSEFEKRCEIPDDMCKKFQKIIELLEGNLKWLNYIIV